MSEKNKKTEETSLVENTKHYPEQDITVVQHSTEMTTKVEEETTKDAINVHVDDAAAERTVIYLPEPKYVVMGSNPATAKAIESEPVQNDGGIVLPIPANVIPNGRGRNILKARQDKPVKNV